MGGAAASDHARLADAAPGAEPMIVAIEAASTDLSLAIAEPDGRDRRR